MQEIESIAKSYVKFLDEVLPNYKFGFRFSNDFAFKYYFDFIFLTNG